MAHARLAPSSAHTWLRCTAMPMMCENLEETAPKEWSSEGTVAHTIFETCLRLGIDAWHYEGFTYTADGFYFKVSEAWCRHLQKGIDQVRDYVDRYGGKVYLEYRVPLDRWLPGQFGTLDVGIVTDEAIIIFDLKFGQGHPVKVRKNEQLRIYGLGFWDAIARHVTKTKRFIFHVHQPRVVDGGGTWECTLDELLAFGDKIKERAKKTYTLDAVFKPSVENCKFCKAAEQGRCPALRDFVLGVLKLKLSDVQNAYKLGTKLDFSKVEALTPEERTVIINNKPLIDKFMRSIHERTLEDAEHGKPTPGLVLVEGQLGHRKWKNIEKVKDILGKAFYIKKEITPTELEETNIAAYKQVKKYVKQGRSRPTLAPKTSKRERVVSYAAHFKNVNNGEK